METPAKDSPVSGGARRPLRFVARGLLTGLLLAVVAEAVRVLAVGNFHAVLPGEVYRCSQPSPARMERLVRRHGIRTVVNLRGCCPSFAWYENECRATAAAGVCQEDLCLSAGRLPSVGEVRRLVEVIDRAERPILFHCRRGSDRTGLASAVALLLESDTPLEDACRQLGPRYGHVPLGRPANLSRFFDLYREWLDAQGIDHAPDHFRRWATREYCPGECSARIEPLEVPAVVRPNEPFACRVRCRNTSLKPWRLCAGTRAGIHASFVVTNPRGRIVVAGRAGLFDAVVEPGESIDLTLPVSPLGEPGPHLLIVDMVDEQHCTFYQAGSEPLQRGFEVREQEAAAGGQRGATGLAGLADRLAPGD
jgi:hypothetical protein